MSLPSRNVCSIYFLYAVGAIMSTSLAFPLSSYPTTKSSHDTNSHRIFSSTIPSSSTSLSSTKAYLEKGDRVLLIGPGFLQLNIAKAAKAAGLLPMIVAPEKKMDGFKDFVNDESIMKMADIGLPDEKGTVAGVVFCSEEAAFGPALVKSVLESEGLYVDPDGPKRTIACVPISNPINKVKGMGWIPIFNNDKNEKKLWSGFINSFQTHPISSSSKGSVVRYGNLLGGSVDGPSSLEELGLDESIYKMSFENYRDLRERSYDRYRLGAQVIEGDATNARPDDQEKREKDAIGKEATLEAFRVINGYPEEDAVCRHVVAQAVVQVLMRPNKGDYEIASDESISVPKEFTILSKCNSELPTNDEWNVLFQNPGPAEWPDPTKFDPSMIKEAQEKLKK